MKTKLTAEQRSVRNRLLATFDTTEDSRLVHKVVTSVQGIIVEGLYTAGPTGFWLIYWRVQSRLNPQNPYFVGEWYKVKGNETVTRGALLYYREAL
jgi:hypothetical protein